MGASLRCEALRCEPVLCNAQEVDSEIGDAGNCLWSQAGRSADMLDAVDIELERQVQALFRLHDLNKNGYLEEEELIQLNKKTAKLHYGKNVNGKEVEVKYQELFRKSLDANGRPVPYQTFRTYMYATLDAWDPDKEAQQMIIEQLIAEASLARACFHSPSLESISDAPYLSTISFDEAVLSAPSTLRVDQPRSGLTPVKEVDHEGSGMGGCSDLSTDASALSPRTSLSSASPASKGSPIFEEMPLQPAELSAKVLTLEESSGAGAIVSAGACGLLPSSIPRKVKVKGLDAMWC